MLDPFVTFPFSFIVLVLVVRSLDRNRGMLRDVSTAAKKPFSFARTQLAWWSIIILASIISDLISFGRIPDLTGSTLVLFGVSSATAAAASIIDASDRSNPNPRVVLGQNLAGEGLIFDILSDGRGVTIHRFQIVVLNLIYGIWFIVKTLAELHYSGGTNASIFPVISNENLTLLGLGSGTYAALKTNENK